MYNNGNIDFETILTGHVKWVGKSTEADLYRFVVPDSTSIQWSFSENGQSTYADRRCKISKNRDFP